MTLDTWTVVLQSSFQDMWTGVLNFVPNLIIAILIIIIGWLIGLILGRVVDQIITSLKVDQALKRAGVDATLQKGGIMLNSGAFVGALVKWFFIVVFLVAAFDVLGLVQVNVFLQQVVLLYLPRVIIAVLVLLVAGVLGDVLKRVVASSAKTAGFKSANFLGNVSLWAVWIFGILVALSHLGIAQGFVQTIFTGFIVALSLALGLSFGLGGQDAAARFIEKTRQEISHKD